MANGLILGQNTTIDTPPTDHVAVSSKADDKLYMKLDSGTEYAIGNQLSSVTGVRNNPESALANLLTALAALGIIVDNTTAS